MGDVKKMKTPMYPTIYLKLNKQSTKMDRTQFRAMICSLLYLTASRLDIMFSVCLCEIFQKEPREVQLTTTKHIFRYLIGTTNLGLMFKRKESFRLTSYCDADYAKDKVERKSTSESCHFIGGKLVINLCCNPP